ncbi:MAG: ABC transporter permease [Chloroflexi bacterium]|nr:ABC transporter permease [Chloroflexota bacterium]
MDRHWFLLRLIALTFARRRSRVAIAFTAITIGVAIVSGLANVYLDVGQKMTRELRAYGANLVLSPAFPEKDPYLFLAQIAEIQKKLPPDQLIGYAPYLYGDASVGSRSVLLAGTNFEQVKKTSPYWKITGSTGAPVGEHPAVVGETVAKRLGIKAGDRVTLTATASKVDVTVIGIVSTGGKEDDLILVDLDVAGELLQKPGMANAVYLSIAATPAQLDSVTQELQGQFPALTASPIRQISQAEGQILRRIESLVLFAVAIILVLTLLCLAITMMNAVMERRLEIGLKKALGRQDIEIAAEFMIEGAVLGLAGGILGWGLGLLVAQGIGQSVFHSSIAVRLPVLLLAVALATGLAVVAAFVPARFASRIRPAIVLKGE